MGAEDVGELEFPVEEALVGGEVLDEGAGGFGGGPPT
jgi:hypothetical protein